MGGGRVTERGWDAVDQGARTAKRVAFAEVRRGSKRLRERIRNAATAAVNLSAKQVRRAMWMSARLQKQVHELGDAKRRFDTYRAEWALERELSDVAGSSKPIIVGPWLSEVGYEVLYWVPFVRWFQQRFRVPGERLIVVTRGGAAAWYADITPNGVELFDLMTPEDYAAGNERRSADDRGTVKQFARSPMDQQVISDVERRLGGTRVNVLH